MNFGTTVYKLDTQSSQTLPLAADKSVVSDKPIAAYAVLLLSTVDCHIAVGESSAGLKATPEDFLLMAGQYVPISCFAGGSIAALPSTVPLIDPTWRAVEPIAGLLFITPIS